MRRITVVAAVALVLVACGSGGKGASSADGAAAWKAACGRAEERAKTCTGEEGTLSNQTGCEKARPCMMELLRPDAIDGLAACLQKKGCEPCAVGSGLEDSSVADKLAKTCWTRASRCHELRCDELKKGQETRALRSEIIDQITMCLEAETDCDTTEKCVEKHYDETVAKLNACMSGGDAEPETQAKPEAKPEPPDEPPLKTEPSKTEPSKPPKKKVGKPPKKKKPKPAK